MSEKNKLGLYFHRRNFSSQYGNFISTYFKSPQKAYLSGNLSEAEELSPGHSDELDHIRQFIERADLQKKRKKLFDSRRTSYEKT